MQVRLRNSVGEFLEITKEIVCMSWTKMGGGKCFAGIDNHDGKWIRVVPEESEYGHYELQNNFAMSASGEFICKDFNILKINLNGKRNAISPHTEDYIWNSKKKNILVGEIRETKKFLHKNSENNIFYNKSEEIQEVLKEQDRSLALIGPVEITRGEVMLSDDFEDIKIRFFFKIIENGYETKEGLYKKGIACTSVKYVAYFKKFLNSRDWHYWYFDDDKFRKLLNYDELFLSIGLGREWSKEGSLKKENWPMIIGIYPIK